MLILRSDEGTVGAQSKHGSILIKLIGIVPSAVDGSMLTLLSLKRGRTRAWRIWCRVVQTD